MNNKLKALELINSLKIFSTEIESTLTNINHLNNLHESMSEDLFIEKIHRKLKNLYDSVSDISPQHFLKYCKKKVNLGN